VVLRWLANPEPIRKEGQIHVTSWQVETRGVGTEGVDACIGENVTAKPGNVVEDFSPNVLLELARPDIVVEVDNFSMKP